MSGGQADRVAALSDQAGVFMATFREAGYLEVAPDIVQPADAFFNWSGEEIRRRSYIFTDLDGEELCLRPDLTIPTCRLHLSGNADAAKPARYCYLGPAFRYQPGGQTAQNPREFEQAGIEYFGAEDREAAEAEVFALTCEVLRAAGLTEASILFGDLGLFAALIDGIALPGRWRRRLKQSFWGATALRDVLVAVGPRRRRASDRPLDQLMRKLAGAAHQDGCALVAGELDARGLPLAGGRGVDEITARLMEQAADLVARPVSAEQQRLIMRYADISGAPRAALDAIAGLDREAGLNMAAGLEAFARRLDLIEQAGCDIAQAQFAAEFGRNLEYYTGFVFQFEVPATGSDGRIAGGGRYDTLLRSLGAGQPIPAMGCAIHTERLLAAATEQSR